MSVVISQSTTWGSSCEDWFRADVCIQRHLARRTKHPNLTQQDTTVHNRRTRDHYEYVQEELEVVTARGSRLRRDLRPGDPAISPEPNSEFRDLHYRVFEVSGSSLPHLLGNALR